MTPFLGQGDEFARLLTAARALRLPHGVVLEGLPGSGKSAAARLLAQALLCGGDSGADLEGSCPCSRRVASGAHADLHLVDLPEDRQDIPVDRVRELQSELERRPVEGRARVAVVDPADRLNEQGQNALLKTLEEPGADTFLLLVTSRPEALLETVRSRCARIRVRPLDAASVRALVGSPDGATGAEVDAAVAQSGGSVGLARLLLSAETRTLSAGIGAFLADPHPAAAHAARRLLDGCAGRSETERRLAALFAATRAALRSRLISGLTPGPAGTGTGVAVEDVTGYVPPRTEPWGSAIEVVFQAERDFASGIPANQVLDGMLLRLVEVLGGGAPATP